MDQSKQLEWIEQTRAFLESLPTDYASSYPAITALRHAFHAELAKSLESRFNEKINSMRQDTYEEKHALATWANRELRLLGLAIKCPKTARPAILVVDNQDAYHAKTRFRLQVRDEKGHPSKINIPHRTFSFDLMEDNPREEGLARWGDLTGQYKGPRQRR
jgi:hypothetical protein